jgi:starch phosphorylase
MITSHLTEDNIAEMLNYFTLSMFKKPANELTHQELYYAILQLTKSLMDNEKTIYGSKKVYYVSAEFLIGRLLSNNLINLGI